MQADVTKKRASVDFSLISLETALSSNIILTKSQRYLISDADKITCKLIQYGWALWWWIWKRSFTDVNDDLIRPKTVPILPLPLRFRTKLVNLICLSPGVRSETRSRTVENYAVENYEKSTQNKYTVCPAVIFSVRARTEACRSCSHTHIDATQCTNTTNAHD